MPTPPVPSIFERAENVQPTESEANSKGRRTKSPFSLYASEHSEPQAEETPKPNFDQDMVEWIRHSSESFHIRIFIIEFISQFVYSCVGPLSTPLLLWSYGGTVGLKNRGFLPDRMGYFIQMIFALSVGAAIFIFFHYRPDDIGAVELKFLLFMLVMRNSTIAIKYAYMSSETWRMFNTQVFSEQYSQSHQIATIWYNVSRASAEFYAEVSFVGILGSKANRDKLNLKFIPWSRDHDHLSDVQGRIDITTKRLIHHPTEIMHSNSRFRKVRKMTSQDQTFGRSAEGNIEDSQVFKHMRTGIEDRKSKVVSNLAGGGRSHEIEKHNIGEGNAEVARSKLVSKSISGARADATVEERQDRLVIETAASGGSVPIEHLFLYFLRGLSRSETAHLPPKLCIACLLGCNFLSLLSPCLARLAGGGSFLGRSTEAQVYTCCALIANFVPFFSSFLFIITGAKDFWRRRALLRSCAALLTLQRYYRRGCPAEVDLLPILDMSDPHTIEAWRKLRQLCMDWGKVFLCRIQAFAAAYLLGSLLMAADFIASLEIKTYMEISRVSLISFAMSCNILATVFVCLVALVVLGNEVNHSAERHAFLLQRQRLVLASRQHRMAFAKGTEPSEQDLMQDDILSRASDFLDVLSQDLLAEHHANPLKLLGAYCGYSLLAGMYFIPASILASMLKFCTSDETYHRCQRSLGNL